jgi:hypothetical protein
MSKSLGKTGVLVKRVILMLRGLYFITKIAMSVGVIKVPVICDGFLTVFTWEVPRILYTRSLVFLNYGNQASVVIFTKCIVSLKILLRIFQ